MKNYATVTKCKIPGASSPDVTQFLVTTPLMTVVPSPCLQLPGLPLQCGSSDHCIFQALGGTTNCGWLIISEEIVSSPSVEELPLSKQREIHLINIRSLLAAREPPEKYPLLFISFLLRFFFPSEKGVRGLGLCPFRPRQHESSVHV